MPTVMTYTLVQMLILLQLFDFPQNPRRYNHAFNMMDMRWREACNWPRSRQACSGLSYPPPPAPDWGSMSSLTHSGINDTLRTTTAFEFLASQVLGRPLYKQTNPNLLILQQEIQTRWNNLLNSTLLATHLFWFGDIKGNSGTRLNFDSIFGLLLFLLLFISSFFLLFIFVFQMRNSQSCTSALGPLVRDWGKEKHTGLSPGILKQQITVAE